MKTIVNLSLMSLSTWTYGNFVLTTTLTPAECNKRLREDAVVLGFTTGLRVAKTPKKTQLALRGDKFTLCLEQEALFGDLAAVMAEGTLVSYRSGTRVVVRIGQLRRRIHAIVVIVLLWLIAAAVAVGVMVYTRDLGRSRDAFIMFGFITLFLPKAYELLWAVPNIDAGPKTLSFLVSTLDATIGSETAKKSTYSTMAS